MRDDANPDPNALTPVTVEVRLDGGARHQITLDIVYGNPGNPMTREAHLAKFRRNWQAAARPLPEANAERLIDRVDGIESLGDVCRAGRPAGALRRGAGYQGSANASVRNLVKGAKDRQVAVKLSMKSGAHASSSLKLGEGEEVLALEVFDQRMPRVVALRRALERLAGEGAGGGKRLRRRHPSPALGIVDEGIPDTAQRLAVRVPNAAAGKHRARLHMQIEPRRMGAFCRPGAGNARRRWSCKGSCPWRT